MSLSTVVKSVEVARVNNAEMGEAIDAKVAAFASAIDTTEQAMRLQLADLRGGIDAMEKVALAQFADLRAALQKMKIGLGDGIEAFDKDLVAIIGGAE